MRSLEELFELIGCIGGGRADATKTIWCKKPSAAGLNATVFKLCGTELSGSCSLLLEHLLLMSIRIANLDDMLLSTRLRHRSVVELVNDFFTNITRLEAAKE